jgi:hypothetical protein
MRPDSVLVNAPLLDRDLGFAQGVEQFAIEELIAEPRAPYMISESRTPL